LIGRCPVRLPTIFNSALLFFKRGLFDCNLFQSSLLDRIRWCNRSDCDASTIDSAVEDIATKKEPPSVGGYSIYSHAFSSDADHG
jgi:hypothetical protein